MTKCTLYFYHYDAIVIVHMLFLRGTQELFGNKPGNLRNHICNKLTEFGFVRISTLQPNLPKLEKTCVESSKEHLLLFKETIKVLVILM